MIDVHKYCFEISTCKTATSFEVAIFVRKYKKIKHIVLQIINIIRLQRKNATILIRMLHFYLHLVYRMAFQELNPKNKKISNFCLQIYFQIDRIFFVLFNSQIAFCDIVGRMIEYTHKQCRLRTLFPGMVAKGFS